MPYMDFLLFVARIFHSHYKITMIPVIQWTGSLTRNLVTVSG
jgi:hypothetical protein